MIALRSSRFRLQPRASCPIDTLGALDSIPPVPSDIEDKKSPEIIVQSRSKKSLLGILDRFNSQHSKAVELKSKENKNKPLISIVEQESLPSGSNSETGVQSPLTPKRVSEASHRVDISSTGGQVAPSEAGSRPLVPSIHESASAVGEEPKAITPEETTRETFTNKIASPVTTYQPLLKLSDDCYVLPDVDVEPKVRLEFDSKIKPRLIGFLKHLPLQNRQVMLECVSACQTPDRKRIQATVLFLCLNESQQVLITNGLKKRDLIPAHIHCRVIVQEILLCSSDSRTSLDLGLLTGQTIGACLPDATGSWCGVMCSILSENIKNSECTLGGMIRVGGSLYALTTAHSFLGRGSSSKSLPATLSFDPIGTLHSYKFTENLNNSDDAFERNCRDQDWALIKVEPSLYKDNHFVMPNSGTETHIEGYFDESDLNKGPVVVLSSFSGIRSGYLSATKGHFMIGSSLFEIRSITLDSELTNGDSGSWVIRDGKLCGYIIARATGKPLAYMLLMTPVFEAISDIFSTDGRVSVEVPSRDRLNYLQRTLLNLSSQNTAVNKTESTVVEESGQYSIALLPKVASIAGLPPKAVDGGFISPVLKTERKLRHELGTTDCAVVCKPTVAGSVLPGAQAQKAHNVSEYLKLRYSAEALSSHLATSTTFKDEIGQKDKTSTQPKKTNEKNASDVEKGTGKEDSEQQSDDPFIVWWTGEDDPENPKNFSTFRKLSMAFLICGMGFIDAMSSYIIAPGTKSLMEDFKSSNLELSSLTISIFAAGYIGGPFLHAPCSEYFGILPVYLVSNVLFVAFTSGCALSHNFGMVIGFRFIAGLFGTVPASLGYGMITGLFEIKHKDIIVGLFGLCVIIGNVISPIVGGAVTAAKGWQWSFWITAISGGSLTICSFAVFRETNARIILERRARKIQKETGEMRWHSKLSLSDKPSFGETFLSSSTLPIKMLASSPVVLITSICCGFMSSQLFIIFSTLPAALQTTYKFSTGAVGLSFLGLGVGMFVGAIFVGAMSAFIRKRTNKPEFHIPVAIISPFFAMAGFLIYGWTLQYRVHWMAPIVGIGFIGMGSSGIHGPLTRYLIDAFPAFSVSAIASITVARALMSGFLPVGSPQLYKTLGYGWGNSLLAFINLLMVPTLWLLYKYGGTLRRKSNRW